MGDKDKGKKENRKKPKLTQKEKKKLKQEKKQNKQKVGYPKMVQTENRLYLVNGASKV